MVEHEDARRAESWWIVLRPASGVPTDPIAAKLAGTWFDVGVDPPARFHLDGLAAVATDRYETRANGITAQVYEIRPGSGGHRERGVMAQTGGVRCMLPGLGGSSLRVRNRSLSVRGTQSRQDDPRALAGLSCPPSGVPARLGWCDC